MDEMPLDLKMSYHLAPYSVASMVQQSKVGVSQVLVPFDAIHGISATIDPNNPLCAVGVRNTISKYFDIILPPSGNARGMQDFLEKEISAKRFEGFISTSIRSVLNRGFTSFLVFTDSKRIDGHVATGFKRLDGAIFILDPELPMQIRSGVWKKTNKPIPLDIYIDSLGNMRMERGITKVIGLPTGHRAISLLRTSDI